MLDSDTVAHDKGETLVELLLAITIMAITFVGLLAGMATSTTASDFHRKQATGDVLSRNAAEAVKKASYQDCPGTYDVSAEVIPASGFALTIDVKYRAADGSFKAASEGCPAKSDLQRICVTVTSSDAKDAEGTCLTKMRLSAP